MAMEAFQIDKHDGFYVGDLEACQRVFDAIAAKAGVDRRSEEGERIASILVQLYRQGVHDPQHLDAMVSAARGIFAKREPSKQ